MQKRFGQAFNRIAGGCYVTLDPAVDHHEIVVDDVAAGHFQGLDQVQRRLLAEGAAHYDAAVVAQGPVFGLGGNQVLLHEPGMLLNGEHHTGAHQEVHFGGRRLPGDSGAEVVDLVHPMPVLVEEGDGVVEVGGGDLAARQLLQPFFQFTQFVGVEDPADVVLEILRRIEVADILVLEQKLPDAG